MDDLTDFLNFDPPKWYERVWYAIWDAIKDVYYWFPRKWFHLWHGFDYRDTWSLDYSIAKWILPRLRYLRENTHGYPGQFSEELGYEGDGEKEWDRILGEMVFAFEVAVRDDMVDDISDEDWARAENGLKLFAEYFHHLWD